MHTHLNRQTKKTLLNSIRKNYSKYVIAILCLTNTFYIYQLKHKTPVTHMMHYNINYSSDLSCYNYNTKIDEDLPSADYRNLTPPPKSIFFHETSCKGDLDSRQACAVESAARAHPEWKIYVLFLGPVNLLSLKGGTLMKLSSFYNIHFTRIHLPEYAKKTVLESMLAQNIFTEEYSKQQASDVLRYLTLKKFGGMYLDLDVVVARSMESLGKNFAIMEDDIWISSAILRLSKDRLGRQISKLTMREIQDFRPNEWSHNGPGVITRVLKKWCSTDQVALMSANTCNGFPIYEPKNFGPIHYTHWELYWEKRDLVVKGEQIYSYHMWNHMTQNQKVPKDSLYANIAKTYCPTIYKMFGDHFGV